MKHVKAIFFRCPHCGERKVARRGNYEGLLPTDVFENVSRVIDENVERGLRQPVVCSQCFRVYQCRLVYRPDKTALLDPEDDEGRRWEPEPLWA